MEHTLRELTSVVGTPLVIDTRVLVDMDFSKKLFHEIMVKREGFSFCVEVAYEWLPNFCTHCQNLGHDVTTCRWLYPRKENIVNKEKVVKGKSQIPAKKFDWVPIQDNPSGVGSSKAF
jgi:hypothetical protein